MIPKSPLGYKFLAEFFQHREVCVFVFPHWSCELLPRMDACVYVCLCMLYLQVVGGQAGDIGAGRVAGTLQAEHSRVRRYLSRHLLSPDTQNNISTDQTEDVYAQQRAIQTLAKFVIV